MQSRPPKDCGDWDELSIETVFFTVLGMRTTGPWFFSQCCLNSVTQPHKKTGTALHSRFDCTETNR